VLEERFPDVVDQQPELLAQHWTEAGSIKEAVAYWTKAGRRSHLRTALVEAITQLRKGLALLPLLVDSPERRRQEIELQHLLGWTLFQANGEGAPEAGEAFVQARSLCDRLGDRSSLGPVLYMLGCHYISRAEFSTARRIANELLQLARERSDAPLEVHAHQNMSRCLHWLGEFASAAEHCEDVLGVRVPDVRDDSLWYLPVDGSRTIALAYLAINLMILGRADQAASRSGQGLVLGTRVRRPYPLAIALSSAAYVNRLRGADRAALDFAEELAAIGREQKFPLFIAVADLHRASIVSAGGATAEGLALARQACANLAEVGLNSGRTGHLLGLASCCARAGREDEALELLDKILERANSTDERYVEAEAHRLKGEWLFAHRSAHYAEVEGCYRRAIAVARKQQAKLWELRASTSLARLWRDQGKRTEARDLLAPIFGWFTEGFDTPDLKEAKALLEELA
jgi:predicted ATPase